MRSFCSRLLLALALFPLRTSAQRRWPVDQDANQLVPGKTVPAPPCRASVPILTSDSLGPLHPGMSLEAVLRACPRAYFGWHWEEGIPEPALAIPLGRSVALAMLKDTIGPKAVVYRILVADSGVRTKEGIGPGSRLRSMTAVWGLPKMGAAECALYVWFDSQPHISWIMQFPPNWDCSRLENFVADSSSAKLPLDLRAGIGILAK